MANGMSVPPLPDLDALSLNELKKLVVQLSVEVTALREENQQLRAENARLKDLPMKPKLAPGGMDKATEPDKRTRTPRGMDPLRDGNLGMTIVRSVVEQLEGALFCERGTGTCFIVRFPKR